jgi:LacI family transcriptional regulator, galactose operon repressor
MRADQPEHRQPPQAPVSRQTIYDLAQRAGVSLGTVSRWLNGSGYVGAATRARIEAAARELDYQPSQAARALAGRRSGIVVLAVPSIANPQWPEVAQAMEDRLRANRLSLLLVNVGGGRQHELEGIHQALRLRADGLAISMRDFQPGDFDRLRRAGTHIVSLSRDIDDPSLDAVLPDRPAAISLAVEHLAGIGHRRIALVHGSGGPVAFRSRVAAYRTVRKRVGLASESGLFVEVPEATLPAGVAAAARLVQTGATAAVATGDALAIGLWIGLEQAGLAIPRDLSLVGMDDIEAAALVRSGLTTVALDRAERGRAVAELLLERINGTGADSPRHIFIRPQLVVRASTAPPEAAQTEGGAQVKSSVA